MSNQAIIFQMGSRSPWPACIVLALMTAVTVGLIGLFISLSPRSGFVNCSMASFHPDFKSSMRQLCREQSGPRGQAPRIGV